MNIASRFELLCVSITRHLALTRCLPSPAELSERNLARGEGPGALFGKSAEIPTTPANRCTVRSPLLDPAIRGTSTGLVPGGPVRCRRGRGRARPSGRSRPRKVPRAWWQGR
jgi:hypothetical protein